jgi:hypothetical protein
MMSPGTRCKSCDDQLDDRDECGGKNLAPILGAAARRGELWAENVVRHLVQKWPLFWPRSPKAQIIAIRRVSDLTSNDAAKARLAKVCMEAARRRYDEITGFLTRKRLALPAPKCPEPDETPE